MGCLLYLLFWLPKVGRDLFSVTQRLWLIWVIQVFAVDSHDDSSIIAINIKASKTDLYRQEVKVYLGATGMPHKGSHGIHYCQRWFRFANQQVPTRERFVTTTWGGPLSKAGLNPDIYAGHSFRIGLATVAPEKGSTIMTLGRWKSNAYQRYI